jgi:hypothetical protein
MKFMTPQQSIVVVIVLAISTSMISSSVLNTNAQTESTPTSYWIDISKQKIQLVA